MPGKIKVPGFELQEEPTIYIASIPGPWLLKHTTPVWRIKDPEKGFQRIVREDRAREIAIAVLDQQRTFPNAIVLATDMREFGNDQGHLAIPQSTKFLVVDGQHRLWAQRFSEFQARYACVLHTGLTEVEMARLFLEINDNQKRVPASLRWDLVRLVRPDDDPYAIAAAELVFALEENRPSPLFQRIDLTGEQKEISLKQASIAPEIKTLVSSRPSSLKDLSFDDQYETLLRYLTAIRDSDPDGWKTAEGPFYKARVLRALLRLLPPLLRAMNRPAPEIEPQQYLKYLRRIRKTTLSDDAIRAVQGSAGIRQIYEVIKQQVGV